jgi:ABC-type antimicrobial peptide transport system permease subunit
MMYLPHRLVPGVPLALVLRSTLPPGALAGPVGASVKAAAPRMPIARLTPMTDLLAEARGPQQFSATLLAAFAWIAVVLAAAGLWGMIAYTVAQRTRELGIRIALGATPRDVMRMAAGRGFALAAAGVALGLVAAAGLSGVVERLLFGVSPTDRTTFALIGVVFLGVATAASVLPARRALRIDPAEALRLE